MSARESIPREWPRYGLFTSRGTADQTVAVYSGLRYVRSPLDRGFPLLPEHRPYAALDGRIDTSWLANSVSSPARRYIELGLARPRAIDRLRIYPQDDRLGATNGVAISVNGGAERRFVVHPGWNSLPLAAHDVRTLRVRISAVTSPSVRGGIAELAIPGLQVRESLRLPTVLASEARRLDLSHTALSVLLARTTADFPYREARRPGSPQTATPLDMRDAETDITRDVTLPADRSFAIGGWASVSPAASDTRLDWLTGLRSGWSFASSGRFEGVPGRRASSAFDRRRATAWIGYGTPGRLPWLAVRAPRAFTVGRLALAPGPPGYRFPTLVRVSTAHSAPQTARVSASGVVRLLRAIRTHDLRITVLASRPTPGGNAGRQLDAVAVGEVRVPGLHPPRPARRGSFATRCGELIVRRAGAVATARVIGSIAALDAGRPLRLVGCGTHARIDLRAGPTRLTAPPGQTMRPDHLRLFAPAPAPLGVPAVPGAITDTGKVGEGSGGHVRVRLDRPAWLVLGESYSDGWRAWCRGRSGSERALGPPVAIDGFANGWRVDPDCHDARFAFIPQRVADAGYAVSGAACLGMLIVLLFALARRRRRRRVPAGIAARVALDGAMPAIVSAPPDSRRRVGWPVALLAAVVVAALGGFLFGLRVGAAFAVVTGVLLVVGVNARRLIGLATLGLAAVPVLYVAEPASRPSGLAFSYTTHYIAAHWVAMAAVLCLGAAAILDLLGRRLDIRRRLGFVPEQPTARQRHDGPAGPREAAGTEGRLGDELGSAHSQ